MNGSFFLFDARSRYLEIREIQGTEKFEGQVNYLGKLFDGDK